MTGVDRQWRLEETHTLLDMIRDLGFLPALSRKGFQNWDVFERLRVLLNRCNIHVSTEQVKQHWYQLKFRFWKRRQMVEGGLGCISAITADFPFYREMETLLTSRSPAPSSCQREAESSGLPPPDGVDSEDSPDTASIIEDDVEAEEQYNDGDLAAGPHDGGQAAEGGMEAPPDLPGLLATVRSSLQNVVHATEQLHHDVQDLLTCMERLNESSFNTTTTQQQQCQAPEPSSSRSRSRRVRTIRRSQRLSLRSHH